MPFITRTSEKGDTELSILIPDNWQLIFEGNGSHVFSTDENGKSNALQISVLNFKDDQSENLVEEKLLEEAKKLGERAKLGAPIMVESGNCQNGNFGTAVYENKKSGERTQVWYISDGTYLVFSTFVCQKGTEEEIIEQAGEIAKRVTVNKIKG